MMKNESLFFYLLSSSDYKKRIHHPGDEKIIPHSHISYSDCVCRNDHDSTLAVEY